MDRSEYGFEERVVKVFILKKLFRYFIFILISSNLVRCQINEELQESNYYEIETDSLNFIHKFYSYPILYVDMQAVKDSFQVSFNGDYKMNVKQFRKTFEYGINKCFKNNFDSIIYNEGLSEAGHQIKIIYVSPSWQRTNPYWSGMNVSGYDIYAVIAFQFQLFYNGILKKNFTDYVYSKNFTTSYNLNNLDSIFADGVTHMMEYINNNVHLAVTK